MQSTFVLTLLFTFLISFTAYATESGPMGAKKTVKAYVKTANKNIDALSSEEEKLINEAINNLDLSKLMKDRKKTKKSDDLVFFDYSEKKPVQKSKAKEKKNVKPVIKKEVIAKYTKPKKISVAKKQTPKAKKIIQKKQDLSSLSDMKALELLNKKKKKFYFKKDKVARGVIMALDAKIEKDFGYQIKNYEFVPEYDTNERLYDDADGLIHIEEKLNTSMSILRGTILKRDKIRTKVDLVLEQDEFEYEIPLLDEEELNKFLDKEKLNGIGGLILLDLDDSIDSVDIDAQYEAKVFLTESLKVTEEENTYRYILYVGVEPGNTLINVLTMNDEEVEKIVHVAEDEVYFDFLSFKKAKTIEFEVHENKVLSKTKFELNIDGDDIQYFNTGIKSKNIGINSFQMNVPSLLFGMRQYLEFKHQDATIFVGNWNHPKIEVPSLEYIQYVLSSLEVETLDQRCMVQVNFNKPVEEFYVSGETMRGPMNVEHYFLDRDGVFNEDATELASKAFILGDFEGVINFKAEYSDGSVDYIQTYCSNDTYLVEHL